MSDENEEDEFHDPNVFSEVVYTRSRSPSSSSLPFSVSTRPKRVTHAPRKYADEQAAMAEAEREKKGSKRLDRDFTFQANALRFRVTDDDEIGFTFKSNGLRIDPNPRIPRNYKAAINGPDKKDWGISMIQEFNSLVENATWRLVKREKWMDVLTGRWVYKIKEDLQRLITRFKSRWVVRGFE
jgi:hypothetical protein